MTSLQDYVKNYNFLYYLFLIIWSISYYFTDYYLLVAYGPYIIEIEIGGNPRNVCVRSHFPLRVAPCPHHIGAALRWLYIQSLRDHQLVKGQEKENTIL